MQLAASSTITPAAPLDWNPGARRGGHNLPTDRAVEVGSAQLRFSPKFTDPAYRFEAGIAQAVQGVELFVERGGPRPAEQVLAELREAVLEVPQTILDGLTRIHVLARHDEGYDRYFEKAYGIPGFQAVAAGGGGRINFFGGKPYTSSVLFHEIGHSLPVAGSAWRDATRADDANLTQLARSGALQHHEFEFVPDPARRARWTPRLAPGAVTPYGASAATEDISEALSLLMSETHFGHPFARIVLPDGSIRALTFGEAYPARTAVLERAARADLDHDGVIGA